MTNPNEVVSKVTQEQVDAMDETAGLFVQIPPAHGGDMRALVMLPANVVSGLGNGTMSLDIEGWDN